MDTTVTTAGNAAGMAAMMHATRQHVRRFFHAPDGRVDTASLADFLQYTPGTPKNPMEGTPEEQLRKALSGVRFRALPTSSTSNDIAMLDTLIAQSDHQNTLTSRFLAILG